MRCRGADEALDRLAWGYDLYDPMGSIFVENWMGSEPASVLVAKVSLPALAAARDGLAELGCDYADGRVAPFDVVNGDCPVRVECEVVREVAAGDIGSVDLDREWVLVPADLDEFLSACDELVSERSAGERMWVENASGLGAIRTDAEVLRELAGWTDSSGRTADATLLDLVREGKIAPWSPDVRAPVDMPDPTHAELDAIGALHASIRDVLSYRGMLAPDLDHVMGALEPVLARVEEALSGAARRERDYVLSEVASALDASSSPVVGSEPPALEDVRAMALAAMSRAAHPSTETPAGTLVARADKGEVTVGLLTADGREVDVCSVSAPSPGSVVTLSYDGFSPGPAARVRADVAGGHEHEPVACPRPAWPGGPDLSTAEGVLAALERTDLVDPASGEVLCLVDGGRSLALAPGVGGEALSLEADRALEAIDHACLKPVAPSEAVAVLADFAARPQVVSLEEPEPERDLLWVAGDLSAQLDSARGAVIPSRAAPERGGEAR